MHVYEEESWTGVDGPGTRRDWTFKLRITGKDSKDHVLYTSELVKAGNDYPYMMKGVYYDDLVFTPEARGDCIQFTIGGQSWRSSDGDQNRAAAWCRVGVLMLILLRR